MGIDHVRAINHMTGRTRAKFLMVANQSRSKITPESDTKSSPRVASPPTSSTTHSHPQSGLLAISTCCAANCSFRLIEKRKIHGVSPEKGLRSHRRGLQSYSRQINKWTEQEEIGVVGNKKLFAARWDDGNRLTMDIYKFRVICSRHRHFRDVLSGFWSPLLGWLLAGIIKIKTAFCHMPFKW